MKGFSIIVCCHNSAKLIADTLRSLCNLTASTEHEILVVDNLSNDGTAGIAEQFLSKNFHGARYRILSESNPGLSHARRKGISESAYDYILFCDDDNRPDPGYLEIAGKILDSNPEVAAAGGFGNAVSEIPFPKWFEKYKGSYSAGSQSEKTGVIESVHGYLWGACLALRKNALHDLYAQGFSSLLSDRKGNELSSGGDVELCYALRLNGLKLYYDPALKFDHFITRDRLDWKYLRRLFRGFGMQKPLLEPYIAALTGQSAKSWKAEAIQMVGRMRGYGFRKLRDLAKTSEGDDEVLRMERTYGRLKQIARLKKIYEQNFESIRKAPWNHTGNKTTDK